jgi:hypothetical protein
MSTQALDRLLRSVKHLAFAGIGFGFFAVVLFAARSLPDFSQWFGTAAAGSLIAAACLIAGAVLGFLFGLPRTSHHDSGPDAGAIGTPLAHHINTNLEQISDWLTKILVGLGLASIGRIPGRLVALSQSLAAALSDKPSAASEQFALAELIFFLSLGFLLGYLWTRLELAPAIRVADLSATGNGQRNFQKMGNLVRDAELAVNRGTPEGVKEGLGRAELALKLAPEDDPSSIPALIEQGRALHRLGKTREALRVVEGVLRVEPDHGSARYNKACYSCILGKSDEEVLSDLELSFAQAPFLKITAHKDRDLDKIRQNPAFKALIDSEP